MKNIKKQLKLTACLAGILTLTSAAHAGTTRSLGDHAHSRGSNSMRSMSSHSLGAGAGTNHSHQHTGAYGTITRSTNIVHDDASNALVTQVTFKGNNNASHSKTRTFRVNSDGSKSFNRAMSTQHDSHKMSSNNTHYSEIFIDSNGTIKHSHAIDIVDSDQNHLQHDRNRTTIKNSEEHATERSTSTQIMNAEEDGIHHDKSKGVRLDSNGDPIISRSTFTQVIENGHGQNAHQKSTVRSDEGGVHEDVFFINKGGIIITHEKSTTWDKSNIVAD